MSNASSPAQAQSPHAESQPSWVGATPMLAPRTSLAAAGLDGARLYAIGGQAGSSTFASVEEYDILSGQWTSVAPMQSARKYCAAAVLDSEVPCCTCSQASAILPGLSPRACCCLTCIAI